MSTDLFTGQPWPDECFAVPLDDLGTLTLGDLAALERRSIPSIGVVQGRCEGAALAAAFAVDLLVAGPDASFGNSGAWSDIVIRRGRGIIGRKAVGYLTMTSRSISAEVARRWGLVTYIDHQPAEAAQRLVDLICARSDIAVATVLKQAHRGSGSDYTLSALAGRPLPGPTEVVDGAAVGADASLSCPPPSTPRTGRGPSSAPRAGRA